MTAHQTPDPAPVFLLFQWVDEREAKQHIGIYSSLGLAKKAAEMTVDAELEASGDTATIAWTGDPNGGMLGQRDDQHGEPFAIQRFSLDVVQVVDNSDGPPYWTKYVTKTVTAAEQG